MSYSATTVYQVWNDKDGDRIDVCEDGDSLGLTEIRNVADDGAICARVTVPTEAIPLLIEALQKRMKETQEK